LDALDTRPLRISWSRLRAHGECPAKGQLLSEGKKSPITDIRGYFHGTVVDQAMRRWLSQDDPQPGQMREWIDAIFAKAEKDAKESGDGVVRWKFAGDKAETLDFCRECVARLEELLLKVCLPYTWDPAVRFSVPLTIPDIDDNPRRIELIGEIDLLVAMPGNQVIVWDLKATKDDSYWRKVLGQLTFYNIAVAIMRSLEAQPPADPFPYAAGLLQPMCAEQDPVFTFTQEDYSQMFQRINVLARDIWRGNVLPKADNTGCKWCEVRGSCPKFPHGRGRAGLGMPAVSPA